jgi:stigma-specific protein Stig1
MTVKSGLAVALLTTLVAACGSNELTCATDQRVCSNACVSVQSDARNCGACGTVCGAGQGCSLGACVDCAANPAACTAVAAAACFATNDVRFFGAGVTPVGPPLAVGTGPQALARVGDTFYAANDLSSDVTPFTLAPLTASAVIPVVATKPDLSTLTEHGGLLWASSSQAQTLVVIDPVAGQVVKEVALGTAGENLNPKNIAFSGTKAYVALNNASAVAVLDVSAPRAPVVLKRIDLARFGTTFAGPPAQTAVAGPARVLEANGRIYVALNNIQDTSFAQVPGANGKLAVIDPSTDTLVGDTALDLGPTCLNAGALAVSGSTLWVGCGFFDFVAVHGAGLLPVSISGATPQPGAVIPTASAIDALALCGGKGYAGATESGKVLEFDPTTGAVAASNEICPVKGFAFVADLACLR